MFFVKSSKGATASDQISLLETKRTLSKFGNVLNTVHNGVCKKNEPMKPIKAFYKHVSERNKNASGRVGWRLVYLSML